MGIMRNDQAELVKLAQRGVILSATTSKLLSDAAGNTYPNHQQNNEREQASAERTYFGLLCHFFKSPTIEFFYWFTQDSCKLTVLIGEIKAIKSIEVRK